MVFSLAPSFLPRTEDETEIFNMLSRKIHLNDLEEDFFSLAEGKIENELASSESEIEEQGEESIGSILEHYKKVSMQRDDTEIFSGLSGPDNPLAKLVEEINACSKSQFDAIQDFFSKPRKEKNKNSPAAAQSIDHCNQILDRIAALGPSPQNSSGPEPVQTQAPERPKKRQRTKQKSKTAARQRACENWEDAPKKTTEHKPHMI